MQPTDRPQSLAATASVHARTANPSNNIRTLAECRRHKTPAQPLPPIGTHQRDAANGRHSRWRLRLSARAGRPADPGGVT